MDQQHLDDADPSARRPRRRSAAQWTILISVWAVGLAIWCLYLALLAIVMIRVL